MKKAIKGDDNFRAIHPRSLTANSQLWDEKEGDSSEFCQTKSPPRGAVLSIIKIQKMKFPWKNIADNLYLTGRQFNYNF